MSIRIHNMASFILVAVHGLVLDKTPGYPAAACSDKKWRSAQSVSVDEVVELLRLHWTSTDINEARQTLEYLESAGHVRRVGQKWKVIRSQSKKSEQKFVPYVPPIKAKFKPGQCRKCEALVDNVNRHNNKSHSSDSCKFNNVRKILEE